jgi:hypothetical protein
MIFVEWMEEIVSSVVLHVSSALLLRYGGSVMGYENSALELVVYDFRFSWPYMLTFWVISSEF